MRTIIVDNNTAYAEALAEDIEDDSESLLSGEGPSTLDEVEDKLNTKIKNLRDKNENSASLRVLINRELKLQGRKRQETLGQSLYQGVTWQYLEVPFFLYAFQQAPESEEIPFVRLPFTPADIPSQSKEERIDSKIAAFLEHFADVHEKVQHGLGDAPATPVNVVRLLNGAAQAGVIRSAEQWMMLRDFLEGEAFSTDGKGEIELLTDDIAHLSDLYFARAEAWDATNEDGEGQRIEKNVVVIDDEVDDEGESLWAGALSIIFEREGFRFSAKRPSEVQKDVATLRSEGADMVLLDIDFRQDPDYEGEREFGGLDLLSTIQEALPHVPVVMMSIYDQIGLYEKCKQHGCYDYLTKAWGTYAKHRTSESEKEWFESWRKAIEVPLRYEAFFKDVDLHEKQEIVPPTSIENLQAALRDIGNPTARTARTLAGFFEDFVFSYLAYRRLEAGDLADALNTAVIEESEQELLAVSNILRVMRNKIFHYGSYMNERLDTWLFLTLQRVFVMRLIKPVNLEDLSWLNVITEDFYLELEDCQFDADKSLFEKHEYIWSQENDSYLRKRAQALENLIGKRTLELEEFRSHAQLFIKSLTALFPKAAISQVVEVSKLGDFEPVGSLLDSIISQESHAGIGLKRGYEILSPIYWLIESRDNRSALMQSKSNHDYEKRLRWLLAARCWIWYFDEALKNPNEMLFSKSLEDKGLDRNDVLQSPNRTLIGDFVRRGQGRYVSAYCLLISITLASEYIIERKDQLPDEEERIANRISELEEEQHQLIEQKTNAILSKEKDKEELQSELNSRQEQYFQAAGRGTAAPNFEDWVEAQENDIEELEDDIEELKTERRWLKQNSDSKNEIERLNEQARELQEAQRRTEDEINKPLRLRSIDRVDALERRMKRKLRVLGQFFDTELDDKAAWLERVRGTASYGNVKACVDEIKGILK